MLCLKETIIGLCLCWKCGYVSCKKTGCVHVENFFLLRKWLKSLVKAIVNTPGVVESSWSPQL
jgi:hypothetical protein